jgi:hypothetical protein
VIAMDCMLLDGAWLVSKSVIRIQPDLRNDSLRMLQSKKGIVFIDSKVPAVNSIVSWIQNVSNQDTESETGKNTDLSLHQQATEKIFDVIRSISVFN